MYKLIWPDSVDRNKIFTEMADFFKVDMIYINELWSEYKTIHKKYGHSKLGERKTLNTEETFVLFVMIRIFKPINFLEVGTLLGRSTRRLLDIKKELNLPFNIKCYDIVNEVKHFKPHEAELIIHDITNNVKETLDKYSGPGIIYLDAHPYGLTVEVIREALARKDWALAVHDCGEILCNPNMSISKDRPQDITSLTGHWERYCLAEVFDIQSPLDVVLNKQETDTHKMRVFSTLHGICSIISK